MKVPAEIQPFFDQLQIPQADSHKGQNGKLLIIGGSELFHVASKWSLDIAARFVDMLFYASVPLNNELIKAAKKQFWSGIVVPRDEVEHYIDEADAILIGPGMERQKYIQKSKEEWNKNTLNEQEWNSDTTQIVNTLVARFQHKKWVIDAGALQMIDPAVLNENCIVTPHAQELVMLCERAGMTIRKTADECVAGAQKLAQQTGATVLAKGVEDIVVPHDSEPILIAGGSPGMTKGGTGDVLSGLVAALYATNTALVATTVASFVNKKAGERLHERVGPFFNTDDLIAEVPAVMWSFLPHNMQKK